VDLRAVDLLARLRLAADVRVVAASAELWALIDLCGLGDVLGPGVTAAKPPSPSRKGLGQPEQREQRLRVEEERHLGDLPADHLGDD
jgi:hypothetical protein